MAGLRQLQLGWKGTYARAHSSTDTCVTLLGPAPEGSIETGHKTELKNENQAAFLANSCKSL